MRIIFIIPVYALCSWLSLRFYEAQLYIVTFRDCFEAYIIWCFLRLIMEWMGGQAECVSKLEARQRMRHPWPFGSVAVLAGNSRAPAKPPRKLKICSLVCIRYCCRRINLNATFIRRCKQGTLQFVILKPFMAVVSIIMLLVDEYVACVALLCRCSQWIAFGGAPYLNSSMSIDVSGYALFVSDMITQSTNGFLASSTISATRGHSTFFFFSTLQQNHS